MIMDTVVVVKTSKVAPEDLIKICSGFPYVSSNSIGCSLQFLFVNRVCN